MQPVKVGDPNVVLNFGKHQARGALGGMRLGDVGSSYIEWCLGKAEADPSGYLARAWKSAMQAELNRRAYRKGNDPNCRPYKDVLAVQRFDETDMPCESDDSAGWEDPEEHVDIKAETGWIDLPAVTEHDAARGLLPNPMGIRAATLHLSPMGRLVSDKETATLHMVRGPMQRDEVIVEVAAMNVKGPADGLVVDVRLRDMTEGGDNNENTLNRKEVDVLERASKELWSKFAEREDSGQGFRAWFGKFAEEAFNYGEVMHKSVDGSDRRAYCGVTFVFDADSKRLIDVYLS